MARLERYTTSDVQTLLDKVHSGQFSLIITTNTNVSLLTNDLNFIDNTVNNLVNYYTKTEIDNSLNLIKQFTYTVESSLPVASLSTMYKIYLVPANTSQGASSTIKQEYITIQSGTEGNYTYNWELLGDTDVDIDSFVRITRLNEILSAYTNTTDLTTLLNAKQPKTLTNNVSVNGTAHTTVENALGALATAVGNATTGLGDVTTLTTTDKTTAVAAINEVNSEKQPKTLSNSITVDGTAKTTVEATLGALNEVAGTNKTNIGDVGSLTTTATTLADAINELNSGKVNKISGSGLMTDEQATKLAGIAEGAQVNIIEEVQVNNTKVTPTGKVVNIDIADFTLEEVSATTGYAKSYQLKKDSTAIGDVINVPAESHIIAAQVKVVAAANTPYTGADIGNRYLDITMSDNSHIYTPLNLYTPGTGISISDSGVISANIDDALSNSSTNAILNVVVNTALEGKVDKHLTDGVDDRLITAAEALKLANIEAGGQVNVLSDWNQTDDAEDDFIKNKPTLGTAAALDVAASGDAGLTEVVLGNDTRLTDARTPVAHTHTLTDVTDAGTAAGKNYTPYVRPNSHDLVESAAVYNAIASAVSSIYEPHGSITCAELLPELLIMDNVGNVYNVTDSGTTTEYFMQGAGKPIAANTTVGIIRGGEHTILFNLMEGMIDLTNYIPKSSTVGLVKNDGTIDTTAYAKQSEMSVVDGTGADLDKTTITLKTGTSATVLTAHQSISGKADKVVSATADNLAALDSNGNLVDSGVAKTAISPQSHQVKTLSSAPAGYIYGKTEITFNGNAWNNQVGALLAYEVSGSGCHVMGFITCNANASGTTNAYCSIVEATGLGIDLSIAATKTTQYTNKLTLYIKYKTYTETSETNLILHSLVEGVTIGEITLTTDNSTMPSAWQDSTTTTRTFTKISEGLTKALTYPSAADCNIIPENLEVVRNYVTYSGTTHMPDIPDDILTASTDVRGVVETVKGAGNTITQVLTLWYYGKDSASFVNTYQRSCYYNGTSWIWGTWSRFAKANEVAVKATKVTNATSGNFAALDSNGDLTDSGKAPENFAIRIPFNSGSGMVGYYVKSGDLVHVHIDAHKTTDWTDWEVLALAGAVPAPTSAITAVLTKGSKNSLGNPQGLYIYTTGAINENGGNGIVAGTYTWDFTYSISTATVVSNPGLGSLDGKMDIITSPTAGHLIQMNAGGNAVDSGKSAQDIKSLIRIDTDSTSATQGYYKIYSGSATSASTREVHLTGSILNDSSSIIDESHTLIDLSIRLNKDGASFVGFADHLPGGVDIIAVGNGSNSYGIYIKATTAWIKARLFVQVSTLMNQSEIITNPTCEATLSDSVQTKYSDIWSKVVTENSRVVGKYVRAGISSEGWYKIYEGAGYNQGEAIRIDLGSFFNNNANSAHVIDIAFGYENAQMSETCRDQHSIFTKLRICWGSSTDKNTILVYYGKTQANTAYANILSTQHSDNGVAFEFVAVDATQYAHYKEFKLGNSGLLADGEKVATEEESWVGRGVIRSATDLNQLTIPGCYDCPDATLLTNAPSGAGRGKLINFYGGNNTLYFSQMYRNVDNDGTWIRSSAGTWTSWEKLVTANTSLSDYQLIVGGDTYSWFDLGTSTSTSNTQAFLFYEIILGRVDGGLSKILVSCSGTMANANYVSIVNLNNAQTSAAELFKLDSNKHLWLGMQSYSYAYVKVYGRWSGMGSKTTAEPTGINLSIYNNNLTTSTNITPTTHTNAAYTIVEIKAVRLGSNTVQVAGILTINSQCETLKFASGLPVPKICTLTENTTQMLINCYRGTTSGANERVLLDKNGYMTVYTNSAGLNLYFSGEYTCV